MAAIRSFSYSFIFLFIAIFAFPANSYFRKTPRDQYLKLQGLDLELPCVTEQRNVSCAWLKSGSVVLPYPGKYQFSHRSDNGDCTLIIHNLNYPKDNSQWMCQVPSLSGVDDYNNWPSTDVVVLVKPSPPTINYDKINYAITAERSSEITCISEGGNPAPSLEWYLNGENITANATVTIQDKRVNSILNYSFNKKNNGSIISCVSVHPTGNQNSSQVLDVLYKPHVSVDKKMYTVLDGDKLEINCHVDANPVATAYWKPNIAIDPNKYKVNGNKLFIQNINHEWDNVVFQCSSQNRVGASETESVKLNVLFQPRLIKTSNHQYNVTLGNDIHLECKFIGNPKPAVRWNFIDSINKELVHPDPLPENPGVLIIKNSTYLNEGDYYCEGINHNSYLNKDNIVRSNKFAVDIVGKPSFMKFKDTVVGYTGLNTRVEKSFCSDPFPRSVYWSYGSTRQDVDLDLKSSKEEFLDDNIDSYHIKAGRLVSLDSLSPNPTCFTAALMVSNTDINDKRDYTLVVQNVHGSSEGIVTLQVYSPLSGAIMISISLIVLIMFFIITIIAILIMRRRSNKNRNLQGEARVPINESSNIAKQNSEKNTNEDCLYANLDFPVNISTTNFFISNQTEYAKISFDKR